MKIEKTDIEGLLIITPKIYKDKRGYFYESFNQEQFDESVGRKIKFVQDNESFSRKGVIRGLHFQNPPYAQGKLVRVIKGSVLDVAVDIRKSSKTYGKWCSIELNEHNKKQFWIPKGFAHGFQTLEENTIFSYKCTNFYNANSEESIVWNDKSLEIKWENIPELLSEKDKNSNLFCNFNSNF